MPVHPGTFSIEKDWLMNDRLDDLLRANRERFKCEHGETMNVPLTAGAAGGVMKCACCGSSYVRYGKNNYYDTCPGCR